MRDRSTRLSESTALLAAAKLIVRAADGAHLGQLGELTTLGRALDNNIVITDTRVSRYHAEIRRVGIDYVLRDLGSTNGTAVAGRRITGAQRIGDNDTVSLGGIVVYIVVDG